MPIKDTSNLDMARKPRMGDCHNCGQSPSIDIVKICDLQNKGKWECGSCHFDCFVAAEKDGTIPPMFASNTKTKSKTSHTTTKTN